MDSAALYPPKKFFGAARNIEHGGSFTVLATALVETGSRMDEVIFEEFKGTGNMELRLDRKLANKRIYPAINIEDSGTRKEKSCSLEAGEAQRVWQVRSILNALDSGQKIELLIQKLKETPDKPRVSPGSYSGPGVAPSITGAVTYRRGRPFLDRSNKLNCAVIVEGYGGCMKTGVHPEYTKTLVRCMCGNEFETARRREEVITVDVCSVLPSVLHG